MTINQFPFDLQSCVEEALDLLAPKAREKHLDLLHVVHDDLPTSLVGDSQRLRQVILNLVGNAIKFTDQGEVCLEVTGQPLRLWTRPARRAICGKSSSPCATPASAFPTTRWTSSSRSSARSTPAPPACAAAPASALAASGLVHLMGGAISVSSEVNRGSTFLFTIRAASAGVRRKSIIESIDDTLRGRRLLVVDDNDTNRSILALHTQRWGMLVTPCSSGEETLALMQEGHQFDAAVIDMVMPGMDGLTLSEALRDYPQARKMPVVLLISGSIDDIDPARRQVGFFSTMPKPWKSAALRRELIRVLEPVPEPTEPITAALPEPDPEPEPAPAYATESALIPGPNYASEPAPMIDPLPDEKPAFRILVVEDNPENLHVVMMVLQTLGYAPTPPRPARPESRWP